MRLSLSIALTVTIAGGLAACKLPTSTKATGDEVVPTEVVLKPAAARSVLTGTIVAPAGVIANNSGGLIANNGGGLIANNGGGLIGKTKSYHALALTESPLASADVYLATADGQPIPGLAPVRADAQGRFTFTGVPKGFSFKVVTKVTLPSGSDGQLATLARATEAATTAKISLASTLVTAALTQGRSGTVGSFNAEAFDKALKATETSLEADDVAKAADPAAAAARVEAVAQADTTLKSSLSSLKQEVATASQSVEDLTKAVATLASAAPTSPAPSAGATTAPGASPTATATAAASPAAGLAVTTLAGAGAGFADGKGSKALFDTPVGIAVAADGTVFVADSGNHRIRKITADGTVTTFAGSGKAGFSDGTGTAATFSQPWAMAIDASDTLYVTELGNNAIRKITPAGVVTTLAGSGAAARIDATGKAAAFNSPRGICLKDGTLYVADTTNQRIRKVTAAGVVTTLAGSGSYSFADGKGTAASFRNPSGIAAGPDGTLYVCDGNNYILRKLTPDGTVTTLAGKALEKGLVNGSGASVRFEYLHGLIVADGHLVVCDQVNSVLRAVSFAGAATTLAGDGTSGTTDGAAASAHFRQPRGVAQGPDGALYVADSLNNRIRVVK